MGEIGFFECLIVLVLSLILIRPEQLPAVTAFIGIQVRKARQAWHRFTGFVEHQNQQNILRDQLDKHNDRLLAQTSEMTAQHHTSVTDVNRE